MTDILPVLNTKEYISNINTQYDIHFCGKKEVDDLVEFIDNHWRKNHIFVQSRKLLDWQHYDLRHDRYNFVIARHRMSNEIHSILGFVPTYQFDPNIKKVEVWLCIWKTREDIQVKGLGTTLVFYLKSNMEIETISQIGISETNSSICKNWGFYTGVAEHFYLANKNKKDELSASRDFRSDIISENTLWTIQLMQEEEFNAIDSSENIVTKIDRYKSKDYYINRYYKHPFYEYRFYAIRDKDKINTILITRECGNAKAKCLRIIDLIGDIAGLGYANDSLLKLLENEQYEYIDFISAGLTEEQLRLTGFVNRRDNTDTIIPNYFEPFLKENIDIRYAYKTVNPYANIYIFKGDSDQDRPNSQTAVW